MKFSSSNTNIDHLLDKAGSCRQQGRSDEALTLYQQALNSDPDNFYALLGMGIVNGQLARLDEALSLLMKAGTIRPDAFAVHYHLGKVLQKQKRYADALTSYNKALDAEPHNADVYNNRGIVLKELKRYEDALRSCDEAIALKPDLAEAYCNRGNALGSLGRIADALTSYDQAISLKPDYAEAYYKRGLCLRHLKQYEDALINYDRAISLKPDYAELYYNRGIVLQHLKRYEDALVCYDRAISLGLNYAEVYNTQGVALRQLRRYEEALETYEQALSLKPDYAEAYNNQGIALRYLRRYDEAMVSYSRAISLKPDYAEAYYNQGIALRNLKRYEEALVSYGQAISLKPDYTEAYNNRGIVLRFLGRYADALANFNRVIAIDPAFPYVYGFRFDTEMHMGLWDAYEHRVSELTDLIDHDALASAPFHILTMPAKPNTLLKCASLLVADKFLPAPRALWQGEHYDHDRIRLAYFSADFYNHATAYLMAELFERHDRSRFELFAFSFGPERDDEMRGRLVKTFDHFIDISKESDQAGAALARELEIDIAVDLKGFTEDSRLGIFALRPAPVQVNYLGYPGTIGAPFIDYIVADPVLIPKDHFEFYSEKVVQMPYSYQVNDSQRRIAATVPTRATLGLPETGFVFCSFNNSFKITPDIFTIWMRLLNKVSGSVLWLLESSTSDAMVQDNLRREAQERGIEPDRLVFAPRMSLTEHLARHQRADLFLDSFYCNAHTTASDALWAGLPVLTCLGGTFAARVAASLLYAIGLPELVTHNHVEYEALALKLATNPDTLAELKHKLARNRSTHPLFDTALFTRHIEAAYTAMWQRQQQGLAPEHISITP